MNKLDIKVQPNQLRALYALTKASIISNLRNPTSLFFNFVFPFIFIGVFGLLGGGDGKFDVAIREESIKSGNLYETLKNIEVLNLIEDEKDIELNDKLNKGQIPVAINIQKNGNFVANEQEIPKYSLDLQTSAADPQNAQAISTIIENIVNSFNNPVDPTAEKVIELEKSEVSGRKYSQIDFILPGQLSFALLSNALFGISMTIISLKKELIIKRIFASPVKKWTLLFSEGVSKIIIGFIQSLLIIGVGTLMFDFTLANGFTTLVYMMILSLVGIFVFIAFGLFVSTLGKTEEAVSPVANIIMMPQLFLSGAFFPIELFPSVIQPIARILPMTFLNDAFKKVAFEGMSITSTGPELLGLAVWGIIMYAIVTKMFKWD